jgi:hypothetical protein
MATFNKFNSFVEALAEKKHDLGSDVLTVALTNSDPTPSAATLSQVTEINYGNCSSRVLSVTGSAQTSGTYKLIIDDLVLTAMGGVVGPFQYVVIYNDTAASDELIGYFNYGSAITLQDGETLTLNFDGTTGILQIT